MDGTPSPLSQSQEQNNREPSGSFSRSVGALPQGHRAWYSQPIKVTGDIPLPVLFLDWGSILETNEPPLNPRNGIAEGIVYFPVDGVGDTQQHGAGISQDVYVLSHFVLPGCGAFVCLSSRPKDGWR